MVEFKRYVRNQVSELREVTDKDLEEFEEWGLLIASRDGKNIIGVSISDTDEDNGSPKIGDMIARNPNNHKDQWLVAKEYFDANFVELLPEVEKML